MTARDRAPQESTGDRERQIVRLVAEAAKEGGLFGIGGRPVTENERAVLTVLGIALGAHR